MKRVFPVLLTSHILFVISNVILLAGPMLPPVIETAVYNQSYTQVLNSTIEYIFVYNKTNVRFFLY